MKKLLMFACMFFSISLQASIIQTDKIEVIREEITQDCLVLFNIAEVLLDTETSLGTQAWRKFIRSRLSSTQHDALTLFVFKNVPPITPEPYLSNLIQELQKSGIVTFAFTSRGRHEWYATKVNHIDLLTEEILQKVNIDFSKTQLPQALMSLPALFSDYFHNGIVYATNAQDKGELLAEILKTTGYKPTKIIFIEDKVDSLKSVEAALENLGIPFVGYAYNRTAQTHAKFDPFVAAIQLDYLISFKTIPSDDEATQIKQQQFQNVDFEHYFEEVIPKHIEKLGFSKVGP